MPHSPWVKPGPALILFQGFLKAPERGNYKFRITGTGDVRLRINDHRELRKKHDLPASDEVTLQLHAGYNPLVIEQSDPRPSDEKEGIGPQMRVLWSGPGFGEEAIPPTVLFHEHNKALDVSQLRREGRDLFETLKCVRCTRPRGVHPSDAARWTTDLTQGRLLTDLGNRLNGDWVRTHLLRPVPSEAAPAEQEALAKVWSATKRTMPQLFDAASAEDQQAVEDILAYLFPPADSSLPSPPGRGAGGEGAPAAESSKARPSSRTSAVSAATH